MENNKILLGRVGQWFWSEFYFDKENNCLIEEKYHEEYLDTGTIYDGSSVVTAQYTYETFVEDMNAEGIANLLKCVDTFELPQASENQISKQEFFEKLKSIDEALWYRLERIDSTYILRNNQGCIIGVLSKTKYFFAYVDLYRKGKGFISENEAFAYIIECMREHYKSSNSNTIIYTSPTEDQIKKNKKESGVFKNIFKKK